MSRRLELHDILVENQGSNNVYFQPPSTLKINYPCIVYELVGYDTKHANNRQYVGKERWKITCISKSPENPVPIKLMKLPLCSFDRSYTSDNLNHKVLNLYF
jgi:hypothetical protein